MVKLEPKEQLILDYIRDTIRTRGYPPSIRDIGTALDIKSTSTVHTCLDRLEKKGYIQRENGKSRSMRVEGLTAEETPGGNDPLSIPLYAIDGQGMPLLSEEACEGYLHYPVGLRVVPENELFAVRIAGSAMIEAGLLDGDIVIVEKTPTADNGDIVLALIDGEPTVRTFYKEDGHFRLQPANRTMFPVIVNSLMILGKVVTSIRYY